MATIPITMPVMTMSAKNLPKTSGKAAAVSNDVALGASLQEQKNRILGQLGAPTNTSSILGKTGYKKEKDNLSGVVLG